MKYLARLNFLFVIIATLVSVSAAQDIKWHAANGVDFSKFKTYAWKNAEKANYQDPVADRVLKKTIDEQLSAKGLTRTDSDNADMIVVYQLAVAQDVEWSSFTTDASWAVSGYDLYSYGGATTNASEIIRKGWLMIDMYDVSNKKLVWQANAVKTLGKGNDPNKMEKNARKVLTKVFKNYPPPAK